MNGDNNGGGDEAAYARALDGIIGLYRAGRLEEAAGESDDQSSAWREIFVRYVQMTGAQNLLLLGQDVALAKTLADEFVTVGGIVQAVANHAAQNLRTARELKPLAEGAPLAEFHKTRFPILQGPMTRVSDTSAFADEVAGAGGLPFLALALMRGPQVKQLLEETAERLGEKSWGVGVLGFQIGRASCRERV